VPESAAPSASPGGVPEPVPPAAPAATKAVSRPETPSPTAGNRAASQKGSAAGAPPPAEPAARGERETTADVAPAPARAKAQEAQSAPAAPPSAEAVAPRTDALAQAAAAQTFRDAGAARVAIQAPGTMWRWRVNRVIEYSSDGGATWRPSTGATGVQVENILAGAAPMSPVAWMVGRRGLVLVTSDGTRFEARTPPTMVDLIGVLASDRQIAVVRGASGETWRTADGGRTWSALTP